MSSFRPARTGKIGALLDTVGNHPIYLLMSFFEVSISYRLIIWHYFAIHYLIY